MCGTCGCGMAEPHHHHAHEGEPHHHPDHHHPHDGRSHEAPAERVALEEAVLARNDAVARANRRFFEERRVLCLNFVSSPGAGKTTLLERTVRDLGARHDIRVVEGDQATERDAERLRSAGAIALQLNTGRGCHLEAPMIANALEQLSPPPGSLFFVENVGNLVCPSLFDLGEDAKVVVASVTEGEDKPLKYPFMFRAASLMVLHKTDLLPHLAFDADACVAYARRVNPDLEVLRVSSTSGEGLPAFYAWIEARQRELGR